METFKTILADNRELLLGSGTGLLVVILAYLKFFRGEKGDTTSSGNTASGGGVVNTGTAGNIITNKPAPPKK